METRIDVEAVKSELCQPRISREIFKWSLSRAQAVELLTAAYQQEVQSRHKQFIHDANTVRNISLVAEHLTAPKKFGLMLCGTCGNGKSTLMQAIINITDIMSKANMFVDIQRNTAFNGFVTEDVTPVHIQIVKYNANDIVSRHNELNTIRKEPYIAIDDLGTEPAEVMDYGNVTSPMVELLGYRYDQRLTTFVTTNLAPSQLKERYGVRIADRFNEMFEKVVFADGSYR